jgi:hypothetical protein
MLVSIAPDGDWLEPREEHDLVAVYLIVRGIVLDGRHDRCSLQGSAEHVPAYLGRSPEDAHRAPSLEGIVAVAPDVSWLARCLPGSSNSVRRRD